MGVALFIVSEALFFLAIFWAYFHSALSPTVELGAQWPPIGIEAINAFELPLLNTVILLGSGVTITYSHHSLIQGNRNGALYGALFTIILALIFTAFQGIEYSVSSFTLSDGAYGSCFYFGTGLITAPINYNNQLSPFWVTGFCDAESSFSIKVGKDSSITHGVRLTPVFSIELHVKNYIILENIKEFFNVGHITKRIRNGKSMSIYSVQSIKAIYENIIPHFNKYPLLTEKSADFILFKSALDIMYNNNKLTYNDIIELLSFKASMGKNIGLSSIIYKLFPEVNKVSRFVVYSNNITSPLWLAGFVSGDGMFYVRPVYFKGNILRFTLVFSITQPIRDFFLLNAIKDYFKCGVLENKPSTPYQVGYFVRSLPYILKLIIPFFKQNPILGQKKKDFLDFVKAADIIKEGLTDKDMALVFRLTVIKNGMNTKRKP